MRRAVPVLAFAAAAFLPTGALAAHVERGADIIDGSGLVDFMQRPHFTVGTWLKYHTTASSLQGHKDDYTVTVIVAGEEVFWGEPCVWIETWTEKAGQSLKATASLISYAAFGDTMSMKRIPWFMRKTINGLDPQGAPDVSVQTRPMTELQLRRVNWEQEDAEKKLQVDTLGRGSTTVPAGTFDVVKVLRKKVHAETAEKGDSTIYYERSVGQTYHYSDHIPLTSLVKIEIDDLQQGKTWLAGRFDSSPLKVLERAQGGTVLVEHGTGGRTPLLVPQSARRSIDRKLIEQVLSMPAEPPVKVLKRGSGQ